MSESLSPALEQRAQELAARIRSRSADAILEMARRLVATTDETLFGATEFALRDSAQGLVAEAYAEHLEKNGYAGSGIDCPCCGRAASFHDYRSKTIETLGGPVACRRAYYYCRSCGAGFAPWDDRVGLKEHRLSPAVERLATLCGGVADSFDKGAVERACKTVVGQRLKGSGMRWSESGGDAVCHVRALYRSERGQWDAFWDRSLAA